MFVLSRPYKQSFGEVAGRNRDVAISDTIIVGGEGLVQAFRSSFNCVSTQ